MDLKDILGEIKSNSRNVAHFRSGRGMVRPHPSGEQQRQQGPAHGNHKQGDGYLRRLLVAGAPTVLRHARKGPGKKWAMRLLERRRPKVVAVALANKIARIAWALLLRNEVYVAPVV